MIEGTAGDTRPIKPTVIISAGKLNLGIQDSGGRCGEGREGAPSC